MGWTAYYQWLRDRPLVDEEARGLAELVNRTNDEPWDCESFDLRVTLAGRADRVIAFGMTKLAMSLDQSKDAARLVAALEEVTKLVGAELRVDDDLRIFGELAGAKTPALVELGDPKEFVAATSLVPKPAPKIPKELSRAIETGDDAAIARAGLERYARLHRKNEVWSPVEKALKRVEDVAPLVPIFLEIWRNPQSLYWFGDLKQFLSSQFLDRVARDGAVVAEMLASLAEAEKQPNSDDELRFRRAERAADMLARGRSDEGIDALLSLIRRLRGQNLPWRARSYLYVAANGALAQHPHPRAFATVLRDRADWSWTRPTAHETALVEIDAARAHPVLMRLAALGMVDRWLLDVIARDPGDDVTARLRELTRDPRQWIREHAAALLVARGEPAPVAIPDPPPEELMAHPLDEIRRSALRALYDRQDRALFVSLVAGGWLDQELDRRAGSPLTTPFDFSLWQGFPWKATKGMKPQQRIEWARGEGAEIVGPQTILPAIAPVLERGADAVADEHLPARFRLDAAEIAALDAEEEQALSRR